MWIPLMRHGGGTFTGADGAYQGCAFGAAYEARVKTIIAWAHEKKHQGRRAVSDIFQDIVNKYNQTI